MVVVSSRLEAVRWQLAIDKYIKDNDYKLGYFYINRAAQRGHHRARVEMAVAMLFGDHVTRNITGAKETFEELALKRGCPKSQFYLGFLYAAGLGVKSSQAKALTYFTFSALGGLIFCFLFKF